MITVTTVMLLAFSLLLTTVRLTQSAMIHNPFVTALCVSIDDAMLTKLCD